MLRNSACMKVNGWCQISCFACLHEIRMERKVRYLLQELWYMHVVRRKLMCGACYEVELKHERLRFEHECF